MKALVVIGGIAAATIIAVAGIVIVNNAMTTASPVGSDQGAEGGTNTINNASSQPIEPGRIMLSSEPVYRERAPPGAATPINQTHISATHAGKGKLTLPNGTQIDTTSSGTAILSFATSSAYAKSTIRTENGETVTATIYEIIEFSNPAAAPQGGGRGIMTVILHTNSTGILAPFNGMILAGTDIIYPNGESDTQLWRWESGIPSAINTATDTSMGTATSETNVTAAGNY